ncbi:MAG: hypothetical protein LBL23_04925 [Coriobacteriales bacterium]|jgi:hypothetical protein|nr:hypothetical protein [Coriobacteriales bacterium]
MPTTDCAFEERFSTSCDLLRANTLNRPILYKILKACAVERMPLFELELFIGEQPEAQSATQPPYFLIQWLVDAGSLDVYELDDEGVDVTDERKEGLSEDEIDDLIFETAYRTNEVGLAVLGEFDPTARLKTLFETVPERLSTYAELLSFLEEPRAYVEVDALLRGRDILMLGRDEGDRPLQPSVFLDKLAAAGGIVWSEGWIITDEGKELLEAIRTEEE